MNYTQDVKDVIGEWGADLVGIADLDPLRGIDTSPETLLDPFTRAVSLAVRLPHAAFEMISDRPTPIYAAIYQTANRLLDDIAFRIAQKLQNDGWSALPIPASQVLDRENWYGAVSHKAVARVAGLGWQGKNLLLITPQYGSRVRLVTVLTDAPLVADAPLENRCGACSRCQDACPAGAIKGVATRDYYRDRDEAMYFDRCALKLAGEFAALPNIGVPICGICIRVCPHSRQVGM
ncbi:MAG: epoxyqueuosine reductase [Deltaproteobacteria bacterium]|nr:epoxyqueuosine reductase [Candidatus Anaeroferrophillacea bacterium]